MPCSHAAAVALATVRVVSSLEDRQQGGLAQSLHQQQMSSGPEFDGFREHFARVQAKSGENSGQQNSSALLFTAATGRVTCDMFLPRINPASQEEQPIGGGSRRQLQTTCSSGDSFTVSSSVYPLVEGCLEATDTVSGGEPLYASYTGFAFSAPEDDSSTALYRWLAGYVVDPSASDPEFVYVCWSDEYSDDLTHPAYATWICDVDGDGDIDFATSTEFSSVCGCTGTSSDGTATENTATDDTAITPTSTTSTTSSSSPTTTCGEGDSFSITSSLFSEVEGCYSEASVFNDLFAYTTTGTGETGQIIMYAWIPDDEVPAEVYWLLQFVPTSSSTNAAETYCISLSIATETHPSEATDWTCFVGTSSVEAVTASQFSVDCGCSGSTTPTGETPTPINISPSTASPADFGTDDLTPTPSPDSSPVDGGIEVPSPVTSPSTPLLPTTGSGGSGGDSWSTHLSTATTVGAGVAVVIALVVGW